MRVALELEAVPNFAGQPELRLRALLKRALRSHGFKCKTVRTIEPTATVPKKGAGQ